MGNEKRGLMLKKEIEGQILFDQISEYCYHDVIVPAVFSGIMGNSDIYGENIFRPMFFDYKKNNKFPLFYSFKLTIRYILFLCPQFIRNISGALYRKIRLHRKK